MATEGRETVHPLIERLVEEPGKFSFFRALWLIEKLEKGRVPVGRLGPARDETARLRPSSALAFPEGDVRRVDQKRPDEPGPRFRVSSAILGLYGVTSPLPVYYSEEIVRKEMVEPDDPGFRNEIERNLSSWTL